ncbi:unnamed protein product [Ambrosiozyma monospora]|uniref:Unnamed protein product n=1 Tax=Ambrosiozyma monospora TaxID=43982 RepID=A0A9W6Z0D6_AMBMO|nr:unnamed protein product [Ambrosiozyma monospora]
MPTEIDTVISVSDDENDSGLAKQTSSTPADIFRQFKIRDKLRKNEQPASEEETNMKEKQQNKDKLINNVKWRKNVDNKRKQRKGDDISVNKYNKLKRKKSETEYICDNDIAVIEEVEVEPEVVEKKRKESCDDLIHEEMDSNDLTANEVPSVGSIHDLNSQEETHDNLLKTGVHTPNYMFTDSDNTLDQLDHTNNTSIFEISHSSTPTEVIPVPASAKHKNQSGISISSILTGKKTTEIKSSNNNSQIVKFGVSNKETPIEVEDIDDGYLGISWIGKKEVQVDSCSVKKADKNVKILDSSSFTEKRKPNALTMLKSGKFNVKVNRLKSPTLVVTLKIEPEKLKSIRKTQNENTLQHPIFVDDDSWDTNNSDRPTLPVTLKFKRRKFQLINHNDIDESQDDIIVAVKNANTTIPEVKHVSTKKKSMSTFFKEVAERFKNGNKEQPILLETEDENAYDPCPLKKDEFHIYDKQEQMKLHACFENILSKFSIRGMLEYSPTYAAQDFIDFTKAYKKSNKANKFQHYSSHHNDNQ